MHALETRVSEIIRKMPFLWLGIDDEPGAESLRGEFSIAETWGFGGLEFDQGLVALLRSVAECLGIATMDLKSQAGHETLPR